MTILLEPVSRSREVKAIGSLEVTVYAYIGLSESISLVHLGVELSSHFGVAADTFILLVKNDTMRVFKMGIAGMAGLNLVLKTVTTQARSAVGRLSRRLRSPDR